MKLESQRRKLRYFDITTDISQFDETTIDLINNHSYFDYFQNDSNIYCFILDQSDKISQVISFDDATKIVELNLGYFRNTKEGELILVFTKTYPNNYLNCAIYEYISNKTLFPISVTLESLLELSKNESTKEFIGIYKEVNLNKNYLISSKEIYSNEVKFSEGHFINDYWCFNSKPNILYKYITR